MSTRHTLTGVLTCLLTLPVLVPTGAAGATTGHAHDRTRPARLVISTRLDGDPSFPAFTGRWSTRRGLPHLLVTGRGVRGQHSVVRAFVDTTQIERSMPSTASWCVLLTSAKGSQGPDFSASEVVTQWHRQRGHDPVSFGFPMTQGPFDPLLTYESTVGVELRHISGVEFSSVTLKGQYDGTFSDLRLEADVLERACP